MDESYLEWLIGLPGFDEGKARHVAARYPTFEHLRATTREELSTVEGVTPKDIETVFGLIRDNAGRDSSGQLFLCPECGSFAGSGAKACPFCGVEFEGSEGPGPAEFEEFVHEQDAAVRLCLTCGAAMGKEATKCDMCGREYSREELALLPGFEGPLGETSPFCSRCGAYLFSDEAECAICGSSVSPEAPSANGTGKGVVKDFLSRWQRMAQAGSEVSEADRLAEELDHYDRLLEANPTLDRAWANRAKVLEKLGRPNEAVDSLSKAADVNPAKQDQYRVEVQNILRAAADVPVLPPRWQQPAATAPPKVVDPRLLEALEHYDSLLRADPSLIVAWRTRGEILDRLGRSEEAHTCYERAGELERAEEHSLQAAVSGLRSSGIAPSGPIRTGRVNGTRQGRTNGRTNGRVNGLAEGRVNGLTTGALNGLTFGKGATNGLVNGDGFTNGRRGRSGPSRIPVQPHWSRSVIGIAAVVALMVIVPVLASMLSPSPRGPSPIIRIDGDFSDWTAFPAYTQSALDPTPNPAVHLVAVKVVTQDQDLFAYAKVQGLMFQGSGANETDTLFFFIDEDNNRNTGYPIGDLGADSMVEVFGWRDLTNIQHSVVSYAFNETGQVRSNDWRRFLSSGFADAAFNGQELEMRTTVRNPASTRVLVYAADNLGNFDPADGSIRPARPTVIVGQQMIAKDIVASSQVPFFRVTLAPMGGVPHVTGLNITRRGTSVDSVDLALYKDNGNGVLDAVDPRLSNATMAGNTARLAMNEDIVAPGVYWIETRWTNRTPTTTFGLVVSDVSTNGTASFRAPENSLVYLGAAPTSLRVDGAFGDWQGRPYGQDLLGDVVNRTGARAYDANVDLLATAVDVGANFTGYAQVDGRMLGGQDIPTSRVRTYPQPPSNSSPPSPVVPPQQGVDVVYAYIDADNSSATGLRVDVGGRIYGFDYAIAVIGRNGVVNSSGLYAFVPSRSDPWNLVAPVTVGLDAHRAEFATNATRLNLKAGYRVVYYASDWRLEYDVALPDAAVARFPIAVQAATNVVINEVKPKPNPEWIELANPMSTAVSLNGWNLARVRGGVYTIIFTFTTQVIGAWGSGSEYLVVNLPGNALPNGNGQIALRRGTTVIDQTTYSSALTNTQTWARFKDPVTGMPMDTNNDAADFYISLLPSPGGGNDRHRPTIGVAKTADRATLTPGDLVTYSLYYNNTNTGMAKTVWVNDTLPAGLAYASSSVPFDSILGSTYGWIFTNVMPGAHSFTVSAQVTAMPTDGQVLSNTVTLDYTDQLSRPLSRSQAWANVTVSRPTITVVKTVSPANAKPGDFVTFTIFFNNTGSVAAGTVTIKDSLPNGFDFFGARPAPTWTDGRTFYWNFTNVAPGSHSITMSARVNATFNGTQLVNWVFLNYTTLGGYPLVGSTSSAIVAIPELSDMIFVIAVPLIIIGLKLHARRHEKE